MLKKLAIILGGCSFLTISYLLYVKRRYRYLKSLGYDGPAPRFLLGNLMDFISKENYAFKDSNKAPFYHYSKTLRRWTKTYGFYLFFIEFILALILAYIFKR